MAPDAWSKVEESLLKIYALPHNAAFWKAERTPMTPEQAAKKTVAEIRSGIAGPLTEETFQGPRLFLRVVGRDSGRAYSGQWWFDGDLLDGLERAFSRIYFESADKKAALRDMLRELLAISAEWNKIEEVWAMEVPAGQRIVGFSGIGSPQKLLANVVLSAKGNRMLVGKAKQIFFPVKNPLWVKQYERLAP